MKKKLQIAVIAEQLFDDYTWGVLHGVFAQVKHEGVTAMIFAPCNADAQYREHFLGECNIYQLIPFDRMDAVLYIPSHRGRSALTEQICALLQTRCRVPIVTVGTSFAAWDCVVTDSDHQINELVRHFTDHHGYGSLGLMTDAADVAEGARFRAVVESAAGCPVACYEGDAAGEAARRLGEQMLCGEAALPRAMLFSNDAMAIAFCDTVAEGRLEIPQHIAIAGFGGTMDAAYHVPKVASVSQPLHQAGVEAVVRLVSRCCGFDYEPQDIAASSGVLECGTTCGCSELEMPFPLLMFRRRESFQRSMRAFSRSNMMVSLEEAENLVQFQQCLNDKVALLPGVSAYALCLCKDWDDMNCADEYRKDGYSAQMLVNESPGIPSVFTTEQLVPASLAGDPAAIYLFLPVHFNARCFGYSVMRLSDSPESYNSSIAEWNSCVCNGLEFIRVRNHLMRVSSRLSFAAVRDPFTGLFDRQAIPQILAQYALESQEADSLVMAATLDIDHFTYINNQYGYAEGDTLILNMAKLLTSVTGMEQTCFRLEGGRFLVVGIRESEQECKEWQRLLDLQIREYNQVNGLPYAVSLSVGIISMKCGADTDLNVLLADSVAQCDRKREQRRQLSALPHYMELLMLRKQIYAQPDRKWNIDEMCSQVYLSRTYFQTIYHRFFGVSCKQDVTDSKMLCAKRLLRTTDAPIAEIAEQCAYDNVTSFLRRFKQCTGTSPDQFRRMMQLG